MGLRLNRGPLEFDIEPLARTTTRPPRTAQPQQTPATGPVTLDDLKSQFDTSEAELGLLQEQLGQVSGFNVESQSGRDQFVNFVRQNPGFTNPFNIPGIDVANSLGLRDKKNFAGAQEQIARIIEARIQENLKSQKSLQRQARDLRLAGLTDEEERIRAELDTRKSELNQLINQQLQTNLEETKEQGGEARATAGQQFSQAGLLRSSAANRGFEQIDLAQQEQEAQNRLTAETAKTQLDQSTKRTLDSIQNRRRELELQGDLTNLRSIEDLSFNFDVNQFEQQLQREISQIEEAGRPGFLGSLIGGIVSGGISILTGGLVK